MSISENSMASLETRHVLLAEEGGGMSKTKEMPAGFICNNCGKRNEYGAYVAAHWDEHLTHTCDCGVKHSVYRGMAFSASHKFKKAEVYYKEPA